MAKLFDTLFSFQFYEYDKVHGIREAFCAALKNEFPDMVRIFRRLE